MINQHGLKATLSTSMLLIALALAPSCKKFVEVAPPTNQIINPLPFTNDATAAATIIGIYSEMMRSPNQFSDNLTSLYEGMAADELYFYSPSLRDEFVNNEITQANHQNLQMFFWEPAYKFIYTANLCIEQLTSASSLTPALRNQLLGESKFIRAFCYYNLVNFFGDVPLALTSDYRINANLPRTPEKKVYEQIISDLKDGLVLLGTSYPSTGRVRPNKWTAATLLARVYLYNDDWVNAELEANSIINSGAYNVEPNLNDVFLKDSKETIWQLMPVDPFFNTYEGYEILQPDNTFEPTYFLTNSLLNSFESGDQRKTEWVGSRVFDSQLVFFPYKYKVYGNNEPVTEFYVVFRLAELYLIRAEARTHQNDFNGAQKDINILRSRAGLQSINFNTQDLMLNAIEHERQVELFCEWGHRWNDLKRTKKADAVLGNLKPNTWQSFDTLWPIPQNEIILNHSLIQNSGY